MEAQVDYNYNVLEAHDDNELSSLLEKKGQENHISPTLNDENEAAAPATAHKDDDEQQQKILARRKRDNERKRLSRQIKNRLNETIITLVNN